MRRCRRGKLLGQVPEAQARTTLVGHWGSISALVDAGRGAHPGGAAPGGDLGAAVAQPPLLGHRLMTALQPRAPARRSCLAGGSWRVEGLRLSRGRGVLASDAGANWVRRWAQFPAVAPRTFPCLWVLLWLPPSRDGSEWRALCAAEAFYSTLPPPPTGFPLSLLPCARPALPSPRGVLSPGVRTHPFRKFPMPSRTQCPRESALRILPW